MSDRVTRDWGISSLGINTVTHGHGGLLVDVVRKLSPTAKQAMSAAVEHGLIRRGTWSGCAFNQAGAVVAEKLMSIQDKNYVRSTSEAAEVFNMTSDDVNRFIVCWDGLPGSDEECTAQLRDALNEVGIFAPANERKGKRVIRQLLYKSEETRMMEAFKEQLENFTVPATAEAAQLLCAAR